MPADPNCPKCKGEGHTYIDGMTAKICVCLVRHLFATKLGFLYRAKRLRASALAKRTTENLLILANDAEINPHLRYTFIRMGLDMRWLYTNDSALLQAWLSQANDAEATNLHDLASWPFLVLRLGIVGYKNVALSGAVTEFLMLRQLRGLPTWVVTHRELKAETCLEYSHELEMFLGQNYTKYVMPRYRQDATSTTTAAQVARGVSPKLDLVEDAEIGDPVIPEARTAGNTVAELRKIAMQAAKGVK